jgi:hypothetical protein
MMFGQSKTALGLDARRIFLSILGTVLLLVIASLVAKLANAGDQVLLYAFVIAAAILVVRQVVQGRQRTKEILQLAETLGFEHFGVTLPASFPLHKTSSRRARSISRAYVSAGSRNEMLFFDCELGHGRWRFSRTVVALRGDRAEFGAARFGPDIATEDVSGWTVVYGERRLLEPGEIARLAHEAINR